MTKGLIISAAKRHGRYLPRLLARKLEENNIPSLLSVLTWPRDELVVYNDGSYNRVDKGTIQGEHRSDFAWNGGTFLKGDNFIIGSLTANPAEKQEATHKALMVDKGYYFDISQELDALNFIKVEKRNFFKSSFPHIDVIYNIGNTKKVLFTYNHEKLIKTGKKMEETTGYKLILLPLEEARFASVGFVEFNDKIILDKRAKQTNKILRNLGYDTITTPFALKKVNQGLGSLRCITTEMPIELEKLASININDIESNYQREFLQMSALLYDLEGRIIVEEDYRNKLKINKP